MGSELDADSDFYTTMTTEPEQPADEEYEWRDIGDGRPVRVGKCPSCDVCPSDVGDCGHFGDPECPYFGIRGGGHGRTTSAIKSANVMKPRTS